MMMDFKDGAQRVLSTFSQFERTVTKSLLSPFERIVTRSLLLPLERIATEKCPCYKKNVLVSGATETERAWKTRSVTLVCFPCFAFIPISPICCENCYCFHSCSNLSRILQSNYSHCCSLRA